MTLTGIPAVDYLVIAAVAITAIGVIWRTVLRPLVRVLKSAEETLPVVLDIAKEFKANHGSSLRDVLDRLSHDAKDLSEYAHGFKHDFVDRFTVVLGNQDLMAEHLDELTREMAIVKADIANVKAIIDSRKHPR